MLEATVKVKRKKLSNSTQATVNSQKCTTQKDLKHDINNIKVWRNSKNTVLVEYIQM